MGPSAALKQLIRAQQATPTLTGRVTALEGVTDYDGVQVHDTFTEAEDTALTSHTGEIGATWAKGTGSNAGDMVVTTGGLQIAADGVTPSERSLVRPRNVPGVADYNVISKYTLLADPGSVSEFGQLVEAMRLSMSGMFTDAHLGVGYKRTTNAATSVWVVRDRVTSSSTADRVLIEPYVANAEYDIALRCRRMDGAAAPVNCAFSDDGGDILVTTLDGPGGSATAHGLTAHDRVGFHTIVTTTGITTALLYYAIPVDATTFKLAQSPGGTPKTIATGSGTGTYRKWGVGPSVELFANRVMVLEGALGASYWNEASQVTAGITSRGEPGISNYYTTRAPWTAVTDYLTRIPDDSIVVCHGNSNTIGQSGKLSSYPYKCISEFDRTRWFAYNAGMNSKELNQMVTEAPGIVDVLYDSSNRNNILVVWEGVNEMRSTGHPGTSAAAYYAMLRSYCLARRAAGWTVIVITCQNAAETGYTAKMQAANAMIRADYRGFADAIVDLDTVPKLVTLGDTTYWDNLHFNAAGLAVIGGMVADAVRAVAR